MVQCGSCLSLLIVSDDDGPFPLKHIGLTCEHEIKGVLQLFFSTTSIFKESMNIILNCLQVDRGYSTGSLSEIS